MRAFPREINIWISGLRRTALTSTGRQATSNPLRAPNRTKQQRRRVSLLSAAPVPGHSSPPALVAITAAGRQASGLGALPHRRPWWSSLWDGAGAAPLAVPGLRLQAAGCGASHQPIPHNKSLPMLLSLSRWLCFSGELRPATALSSPSNTGGTMETHSSPIKQTGSAGNESDSGNLRVGEAGRPPPPTRARSVNEPRTTARGTRKERSHYIICGTRHPFQRAFILLVS